MIDLIMGLRCIILAGSAVVVSRFVGSSMSFLFFPVVLVCCTGRLPLAW
jgi:hypothetical protein